MSKFLDAFKTTFENATGMSVDEAMHKADTAARGAKNQKDITAMTGKNVSFDNSYDNYRNKHTSVNGLSDNFADALKDALSYYKKEFKVTPRANIYSDWEELWGPTEGMAYSAPNDNGNYNVNLRNVRDWTEQEAIKTANESEQMGWWAKGYGGNLKGLPTHELGHVLTYQLFPNDKEVNKLFADALKDIGINYDPNSSRSVLQAAKKAKEISGYAAYADALPPETPWYSGYETVAEALADYYYNRDNAAELSKAIVRRMKDKGHLYGLTQAGGVGSPNETFTQNLRRYSAIQ